MRAISRFFAAALAAVFMAACGTPDSFRADVTISGLGAEEVEACYFNGPAGLQRVTARADAEGRFRFEGSSAGDPTLVEIFRPGGERLMVFSAANGDKVKASLILGQPASLRLRGNDANNALSRFIADNPRLLDPMARDSLNAAVAATVAANPSSTGSSLILMTLLDARHDGVLADSLFNLIEPKARPSSLVAAYQALLSASADSRKIQRLLPFSALGSNDSLQGYVPAAQSFSLLAFTASSKPDSVRRLLRRLNADYPRKRLLVMEVSVWGDSASWRRQIAPDSARWRQVWLPGGPGSPVIDHAALTRVPFFIVADSMGRQLLRTPYAAVAAAKVESLLKK